MQPLARQKTPKINFLHFWGIGPTVKLVKEIKATLDTQNETRSR